VNDVARPPLQQDLRKYLARARARTQELGTQIEAFSARVAALRALGDQVEALYSRVQALHDSTERTPSPGTGVWLWGQVARQGDELALAHEELHAQHDALKEAHALLEHERARYADLFENAPDAYVTTDSRGVIREANEAAARLLGLDRHVLVGKLLIAFVARRDTRAFRAKLGSLTDGKGADAGESHVHALKLRARGGLPFETSLSVRIAVFDGNVELRWILRPMQHDAAEGERALLSAVADGLRGALENPGRAVSRLVDDIDRIVGHRRDAAGDPHEQGVAREDVAPADLVSRAVACTGARSSTATAGLVVGSIEDGPMLHVDPERATWALSRVLDVTRDAKLRGWRDGSRFVLEVRAEQFRPRASDRLAFAAAAASCETAGGRLRVSAPGDDGDDALVCELRLPLSGADAGPGGGAPASSQPLSER